MADPHRGGREIGDVNVFPPVQCHLSLPPRGWREETDDISDYSSAFFLLQKFHVVQSQNAGDHIYTSGKMIRFPSMYFIHS